MGAAAIRVALGAGAGRGGFSSAGRGAGGAAAGAGIAAGGVACLFAAAARSASNADIVCSACLAALLADDGAPDSACWLRSSAAIGSPPSGRRAGAAPAAAADPARGAAPATSSNATTPRTRSPGPVRFALGSRSEIGYVITIRPRSDSIRSVSSKAGSEISNSVRTLTRVVPTRDVSSQAVGQSSSSRPANRTRIGSTGVTRGRSEVSSQSVSTISASKGCPCAERTVKTPSRAAQTSAPTNARIIAISAADPHLRLTRQNTRPARGSISGEPGAWSLDPRPGPR
jgi:hypothetical protein